METRKEILIIEDHDSLRLIMGRVLSKKYLVHTQKDGLDGIAWLRKGNMPDLILLDMSMPRINGVEFLSNIRSSGFYADIPVLAVSAEDDTSLVEQCRELGIIDFIKKPFNPNKLDEKINHIFQTIEFIE